MGTIPIPSIDTVYTYKLGVTMNTDTKYREEKLKNANFFLEACLKELDQDKTINSVPDKRYRTVVQNHFGNDIVSQ